MLTPLDPLLGRAFAVSFAVVLDAAFGDPPPNGAHPVAWLGTFVGWLERRLRSVPPLAASAGAWLHKAVSTLDSMVGYRTEPYTRFGTVSARLDDVLSPGASGS